MNKVQSFRQTSELTAVVLDKLLKSKEETEKLTTRNIYCPFCGYLVEKVFSDISGHKQVYCKKCKEEYVINLGYFRSQKRRNYFSIIFPDKQKTQR